MPGVPPPGSKPLCVVTLRGFQIARVRPRKAGGGLSGKEWTAVFEAFGIDPADVAEEVMALVEQGEPFRNCAASSAAGLLCITGWTAGLEARLRLAHCGPLERALYDQLQQSRDLLRELENAGTRADSSPVPAIETDAKGRIVWHNPAAERLLRRGVNGVTLARLEPGVRGARTQLFGSDGRALGWARATATPISGGGRIIHLEDINAQVEAESDLDSFMTTLTETFAHLEQGLGIFDRDRKLTLFNPALAQMFSLDPALLARRPSLRHFLEALRQRRMLPEQRDYTHWRSRFIEVSTATRDAPHTEDWPLPSGHTLRVSVRRHPRGALAFIFQDISTQLLLESRYRAEIETTQATLDRLGEPIAVFGASGQITYANPAFAGVMGCDPMDSLAGHSIDGVCETARQRYHGAETWDDLRRYILSSERDDAWRAVDHHRSGGQVVLSASALPDGSTLLTLEGERVAMHVERRPGRVRA